MLFHRQKVLIALLRKAGRALDRLELMKWAFLLRHESPSHGGPSFYGFVPYDFGPCSFCLYRDVEKLIHEKLLIAPDGRQWSCDSIGTEIDRIEKQCLDDIDNLVRKFGTASDPNVVIDYVYKKFPSYTINSKRRNRPKVPTPHASLGVYTAGYQGLSVDDFLDRLVQRGIKCLVDVRHNPIARRYGFHKSSLSHLCGKLKIDYMHVQELGIISEWRQNLDTQFHRDRLFEHYESTTLLTESAAIDKVTLLVLSKPTVLVCMEAQHCECHRSRLAGVISKKTRLPIIHL